MIVYYFGNIINNKGKDGVKVKGFLKELKIERFVKMLYYMIDAIVVFGRLLK